tara:strand:- start:6438 stop:8939 length:2502 start_codon:yes stop_codon:yes gene_type:complete
MRIFKHYPIAFLFAFFGVLISALPAQAQIFDPVEWSFDQKSLGDNKFELQFIAEIEPHWHIYAMDLGDDGPIPTTFDFQKINGVELIGKAKQPKGITVDDPMFGMELTYFEDKAVFTQVVKVTQATANVSGELEYMACNDGSCLPPELVAFNFDLKQEKTATPKTEKTKITATSKEAESPTAKEKEQDNSEEAEESTPEEENEDAEPESGIVNPVTWSFETKELGNGEYEVIATATIEEGWHLYALDLPEGDGPIPTSISFSDTNGIAYVGNMDVRAKELTEYDPNFMMDLSFYEHQAQFVQKVKLLEDGAEINGVLEFMTCNDRMCKTPEEVEFTFKVGDTSSPEKKKSEQKSLWFIFFGSIGGGLMALLTPCVFPMIPMTVSFFTKQSKTYREGIQKGVWYGLSIVGIYVLFSLPFHIFDSVSPDIFNEFSTNPYLNVTFFVIFIIFAISFLGAFEIMIPNSWINKADRASDKGGMIGIFFMALTLILVSFSCTGPALGLLLGSVLSSDNGATALTVGMLGFGLGLGLPFGLFAAFPGWMNSLPKSGGWLNVIKVSFGFLELAFAFKFLSNADLVTQSGIITREVFIAIWVGVFIAWSMYLFGLFRLPHDSPTEKISVGRGVLATFTLIFAIYLFPGLWGAPLKLIAGFPPPPFYSEAPNGFGSPTVVQASGTASEAPTNAAHCPHNLSCFHDYEEGMAYAKKVGKPVMLDFTGWACVNCRRMEENVWSDPNVLERLRDDVVLISLYVDEREELPESEQYVSETTGKKVKTIGNKWSDFEITRYQSNTQPYYVMIDHEENQLHESAAYDPSIPKFIDWLDRGKKQFEKTNH